DDADRPQMLRAGLWVPEGQRPDRRGKLLGQPLRVSSTVAFDELSTLYSLMIAGWGQLAREWVDAQSDPESIRDFVNSTLAQCWDPDPIRTDPESVAARLKDDDARLGVIPPWARFVTVGADVHRVGEDLAFLWVACAWGPHRRGQLVA